MCRTSKNKMVKRVGVSAIVAAGALATGGIAGASERVSQKAPTAQSSSSASPLSRNGSRAVSSSLAPDMIRRSRDSIIAMSATSITVQDRRGTISTYTIDSSTKVTKDGIAATATDLAVGEHVRIIPSSTRSTTAAGVEIALARIAGEVISVRGNTITVSDHDGFYRTISVGASTTYSKNGVGVALGDVTVGAFVMSEGTVDANHTTLDASAVGIGQSSTPSISGSRSDAGKGSQGTGGPGVASGNATTGAIDS